MERTRVPFRWRTDELSLKSKYGVGAMAAWGVTCLNCNRQFAQFNIEDDLENLYLPVKPDLPKGGKELACPHCGHKATYQQTDLFYMR
jgi:DNA-directed RNA polymerase subunit RPC12/RpoP